MPAKNTIKIYVENAYYHVYNRGVEKRIIFVDDQDYKVFLRYLKEILSPPNPELRKTIFSLRGQSYQAEKPPLKNYTESIDLIAFCLMPNHFHILIKQKEKDALEGFMRALMTRYSMYFNKRHERVGSLFQGRYKAAFVDNDNYLVYLSKYIHRNPLEYTGSFVSSYSSYSDYLGKTNISWVKPNDVLSFFNNIKDNLDFRRFNSYKKFVEEFGSDEREIIGGLALD